MARALSRRLTNMAIRIVGRAPSDYAEELQRFLEKLSKQVFGGIPAGFRNTEPSQNQAADDTSPGTEAAGWASADHVHPALTGSAVDLVNGPSGQGSDSAFARADHQHHRDVRVLASGIEIGVRNSINFSSKFFVTDNPGFDTIEVDRPIGDLNARLVNADYTPQFAADNVILVDASGGPVNITLPPSTSFTSTTLYIKKIDASVNAVTVTPDGAETIDGLTPVVLALQWDVLPIIAAETDWYRIA